MRETLAATTSGAAWLWKAVTPSDRCRPSEGRRAIWQLVELYSTQNLPFRALVEWTAGDDNGMTALVDVPRQTRIAFAGWDVRIKAANDCNADNRVCCTLVEVNGPFQSKNTWTERGVVGNDVGTVSVPIPPYAVSFRVDLNNPTAYASTQLQLLDGYGAIRLALMADQQPSEIALGANASLQLSLPPNAAYRVTYLLSI